VRLFGSLLALFVTFGACTPEAIEVDPPSAAGAAGEDTGSGATSSTGATNAQNGGEPDTGGSMIEGGKAGSGGSAGKANGGSGGSGNCATLSSPKTACTTCIPMKCASQAQACESDGTCGCGDYAGYRGQMNCLLACPTLSPMMEAAADCAKKCGFDNLGPLESPLHQLFDCLVNPPMGPPLCPECFPVH
jgi:hypothetical protein